MGEGNGLIGLVRLRVAFSLLRDIPSNALRFKSLQEHKRRIDNAYGRDIVESDDEVAVWIGAGSGLLNPKDTFE